MEKGQRSVLEKHRKKLLLAIGLMISVFALAGTLSRRSEMDVWRLDRPAVSEGASQKSLVVVREDGSRSEIKVSVKPRKYSQDEVEAIFNRTCEMLPGLIKGENESLYEVSSDLNLPDRLDEWGVDLIWQSSLPQMIGSTGKLSEKRDHTEPVSVILQVTMSLQEYSRMEKIPLMVAPVGAPSWEERLSQELAKQELANDGSEQMELPLEFEGESIAFVQTKDRSKRIAVAMLPAVVALFLYMKEEKQNESLKKQRQEEITSDYPDLVVKMTILFQAGMSMRNVWERIASDEKKSGKRMRAIYEEVIFACNSMADGVSEMEAYRQFGHRCGTAGCLKLGNMLAGNVRRGTKHLTAMMAEESARAWQLRKHQARRSGEKAGTKMLLPMFMMFGVVLAMVVVPAFYGLM